MNDEKICPKHGLPINAVFTYSIERRRVNSRSEFTGESSRIEGPTILGYACPRCLNPISKELSAGCQITLVQAQPAEV